MFQPWRAQTTIINLCLTGKTFGFESPRAPMLQILWGVATQTHIDYAERIWEEFTQSIHTFIDDKRNLAHHTLGKKKATLIVIPTIRFTKLIIYHLQRKHKFHPRPDSPLYLPNEEHVLRYIMFSVKRTKREVFGMPIPGSLITTDIQEASYYQNNLAKVAKHQRHDESSPLYVELGQSDSKEESKKVVPGADAGGQGECQAGPDPGAQAEGQAGPDPDREHMDLDVADVSPQPPHEQMDEGFTTMAYPKVQENLKLTVEEQVLLEEPTSSSGTLSSLQHLSKDLRFGDLFLSDKPSEADNNKATAETKVESMVSITIQEDMSSIPPMTSPIINLTSRPESPKVHQLKATATKTTTTTTSLPPPYQQQQSTTYAMMMKRISDLEHIMANLIQENKKLAQRLENHRAHLYILEQLDIPHQVSKAVNEVVTDAVD
nr:monodehydroascorbate reductase [Tanacetum cinerariifolium]